MINLLNRGLLWVVTWILKLIDYIFALFKIVAGIENVKIGENSPMNLLNGIMAQNTIFKVFIFMMMIGITAGVIFTVFSTIKNMAFVKKTNQKILTQFIASILGMFVVFMTIFIFIYVIGQLLGAIGLAFSNGNTDLSIGNQIIKALGETSIIPGREQDFNSLFDSTSTGAVGIYQADFVDNFYGTLKDEFGIGNYSLINGIIDHHTFQIFIALVAACIIGWCAISAIVQLVIRIYDIVFMILVMPLPLSAYPLDDGERFRSWKKAMISKMFLAYGTIIAVNVYLLIIPIISTISFSDNLSLTPNGSNVSSKFLLNLFQIFMIVAGGFTISGGQLLFARIMGTDAEEGRQAQQTFRNAIAGIGTAAGIAKGAGKLIFGKKPGGAGGSSGMSGAGTTATANGGRFQGIGSGSVFKAAGKAGLMGAGVNIASRLNRKLFGEGSGHRLASGIRNNKVTQGIKSSGAVAAIGAMGSMIRNEGLIRGLGYSKLAAQHGRDVYRKNAGARQALKEQKAQTRANFTKAEIQGMKLQEKQQAKQNRIRNKELNFTFRNVRDEK